MLGNPQAHRFDAFAAGRSWLRRLRETRPSWKRTLPATLGAAALAAVLTQAGLGPSVSAAPQNSRFGPQYFTDVMVTTHEGKTVPFYDGLIKDKKVVINFMYLNCNDICPLQTSRVAQIRQKLGDQVGKDFFIYSITMDPEHDTPELLNAYAEAFGAGGGWLFITGKPEDLDKIRWRLGERSRNLSEHRNDLVLGNDETGEWSRSSVFENPDVAVSEIRELDPVYFKTKRTITTDNTLAEKSMRLDQQPGEALFIKGCSTCHSIGGGDFIGPDLKDISERRDPKWLSRFMIEPNKMRFEKDPLAMELLKKFKGIKMPNLGLKQEDVDDLLNYIAAKSKEADAKEKDSKAAAGPDAAPDAKATSGAAPGG
jgi:cytochrome oxidase Cu insertion factor (SCO1/SenC/PrrC family)/cytochrome c2